MNFFLNLSLQCQADSFANLARELEIDSSKDIDWRRTKPQVAEKQSVKMRWIGTLNEGTFVTYVVGT